MNGKFDEKLAQLAFGELSPDEAARIEAQAATNPEALKVLATYRSMKGGMGDLMEIPEDQFSKDRLRNAILMQGLKPQPEKASPLGWLWMPATAFLLAAGVMMFNPRSPSGEPMVAVNDTDIPSRVVVIKPPKGFKVNATPKKQPKQEQKTLVVRNETPRQSTRNRDVRQDEELAQAELNFGTTLPQRNFLVQNDPEARIPAMPAAESRVSTDSGSTSAAIVIIEDKRDESTGAYRATEVGTASNVLIGG